MLALNILKMSEVLKVLNLVASLWMAIVQQKHQHLSNL